MVENRLDTILTLANRLAPRLAGWADEYDRRGQFARSSIDLLRSSGYTTLTVPEHYGGQGANLYELCRAQYQLAQGDGISALAVGMHLHVVGQIAQGQLWPDNLFASFCRQVVEQGALINSAASEPDLGSPSRGGKPATSAQRVPGGYCLTGHKTWTSMAPALTHVMVTATVLDPKGQPTDDVGQFLVTSDTPGYRVDATWGSSLAMRASGSDDLVLQDVFVPEERRLDRPDAPPRKGPVLAAWFAGALSAVYLGIGAAAVTATTRYCDTRVPTALGRAIATVPNVQRKVGEMQIELLAARTLLFDVLKRWSENPQDQDALWPEVVSAKYVCTNTAIRITDLALRTVGGAGLTRELPLERYFRDVRAGLYHPPQDDAALELVGKAVLGIG